MAGLQMSLRYDMQKLFVELFIAAYVPRELRVYNQFAFIFDSTRCHHAT